MEHLIDVKHPQSLINMILTSLYRELSTSLKVPLIAELSVRKSNFFKDCSIVERLPASECMTPCQPVPKVVSV